MQSNETSPIVHSKVFYTFQALGKVGLSVKKIKKQKEKF